MQENYKYWQPYGSTWQDSYAFADAGYNGGNGGVNSDRRACKISRNCDPSKWFGNVEKFCTKSKVALYGQRSACDINRHHVDDVLRVRVNKYNKYFIGPK